MTYLDFENRANYTGNLYARNVINGGRFAIRGEKGGYSDGQYLSEYRSHHPNDTRSNETLLALAVRNTVDNGIYCPGGSEGHLTEDGFLQRFGNAWGDKVCRIVRQLKEHVMMPGALISYSDVLPGEADPSLIYPGLADQTSAYRWPWGYNCGNVKQLGEELSFADASSYPRINSYRNGRVYYYGEPDFESVVQANIAEDRHFLYTSLNFYENSYKLKKKETGFLTLWMPFHDGAQGPSSTHFDYPIRNDAAEAMAIFGIYYSATFIVWTSHGHTPLGVEHSAGNARFRACEQFIGGLKRMSWHNDMRTGDFERLIPEISLDGGQTWHRDNVYQSKQFNRPIVRAIVKGNEIMVIGYNNTTNDARDMEVKVRYNTWQDTIVLKGTNEPTRRTYVGRAVMN